MADTCEINVGVVMGGGMFTGRSMDIAAHFCAEYHVQVYAAHGILVVARGPTHLGRAAMSPI